MGALAAALLLAIVMWGTRHHIVTGESNTIYVVNRWTGSIQWCRPSHCRPVDNAPAVAP